MHRATQYRQGDVLLVAATVLLPGSRPVEAADGRVILARGEVTGHAHSMAAERVRYFREDETGRGFIQVHGPGPVALRHEEHAPVNVEPGLYEVRRQREYRPRAQAGLVAD
ncbi:hypothetical protein [Azospirillum canadense]|uniref:hypothetical protein n=1 Tax=Azospirillum canadense TaxID=403962 RepID=UPI0022275C5E|nr:hypothetical protein [Azospirillum canadense]MCW2239530.1 hypothetical protein [Azospirillum canadense]